MAPWWADLGGGYRSWTGLSRAGPGSESNEVLAPTGIDGSLMAALSALSDAQDDPDADGQL